MYQEAGITISLAALACVFALYIQPFQDEDGAISGAPNFAPWLVLAINFLSFLFYWKFVPETKFHSLEELELKFQKAYS